MIESPEQKSELAEIAKGLVGYITSQYPSGFTAETLPLDQSLLDLGVLDSAGVIEFIVHAESKWDIEISDADITKERMGSVNKMAKLVQDCMARRR